MGTLMSVAKAIDSLRFVKIGTKPVKATRVVNRGNTTVVELASGALWSSAINHRFSYTPGHFSDDTLRILVALGRVPKASYDLHQKHIDWCRRYDNLRDQAKNAIRLAKESGVVFSAAQMKRLHLRTFLGDLQVDQVAVAEAAGPKPAKEV